MDKSKKDRQQTHIVDIKGLAKVLLCSESMILKTWKQYPHFYIGHGCTAKGARFDVNDVIGYLKKRDYADIGQKKENLDGQGKAIRSSCYNKTGLHDENCSQRVGTKNKNKLDQPTGVPFNLLAGIN